MRLITYLQPPPPSAFLSGPILDLDVSRNGEPGCALLRDIWHCASNTAEIDVAPYFD